eukprot:g30311.t2
MHLRKKIHWVPFTFACVTGGRFVGCFTDLFQEGCNADEKFYAVLARGCLQLHQPLKAVEVIKAAYKLESALPHPARLVGVEGLDELLSKIGKEEQELLSLIQLKPTLHSGEDLEPRGCLAGRTLAATPPQRLRPAVQLLLRSGAGSSFASLIGFTSRCPKLGRKTIAFGPVLMRSGRLIDVLGLDSPSEHILKAHGAKMQQKWHAPSHGGLVESDFGGQEAPVSGHWHRHESEDKRSEQSERTAQEAHRQKSTSLFTDYVVESASSVELKIRGLGIHPSRILGFEVPEAPFSAMEEDEREQRMVARVASELAAKRHALATEGFVVLEQLVDLESIERLRNLESQVALKHCFLGTERL